MVGRSRGVSVVGLPVLEEYDASDPDRRARELKRHACPACGRHQAAPVGIATVYRGLDERRVRYRPRGTFGVRPFPGTRHANRDKFRRALAAADDAEGKLAADRS